MINKSYLWNGLENLGFQLSLQNREEKSFLVEMAPPPIFPEDELLLRGDNGGYESDEHNHEHEEPPEEEEDEDPENILRNETLLATTPEFRVYGEQRQFRAQIRFGLEDSQFR